jgi:hypothetical protein
MWTAKIQLILLFQHLGEFFSVKKNSSSFSPINKEFETLKFIEGAKLVYYLKLMLFLKSFFFFF